MNEEYIIYIYIHFSILVVYYIYIYNDSIDNTVQKEFAQDKYDDNIE